MRYSKPLGDALRAAESHVPLFVERYVRQKPPVHVFTLMGLSCAIFSVIAMIVFLIWLLAEPDADESSLAVFGTHPIFFGLCGTLLSIWA